MPSTELRERVQAAAAAAPLSEMSAGQREELERELALADSLGDLPGKWQAAVLEAELGVPHGHCCHGGS
jgi:hypothetical protein